MMIAYHCCFDLTYFGWADWPMLVDARWIAWRSAIVASFLFVVGISLALRDRRGTAADAGRFDRSFIRRWLQIVLAAVLVTAGSAWLFPRSFIYFGVLHFVAVAILLCRRAPRLGGWAVVAGCAALANGLLWSDAAFDPRVANWIGFAAEKPLTEDYVPLFPWVGVVLIGCGAGARWTGARSRLAPAMRAADGVSARPMRALAATGRWSLAIYLVHQPVMLGVMGLIAQMR